MQCKEEINSMVLFQTHSRQRPKLHHLPQGWIQPNFEGGRGKEGVKDGMNPAIIGPNERRGVHQRHSNIF